MTTAGRVLLIHAYSDAPDVLTAALRVARNAVAGLGDGATVQVVVQGGAVRGLTADTALEQDLLSMMQEGSVDVIACRNSMRSAGIEPDRLLAGVGTVPAAVSHLAELQWAGAAYVRL